MRHLQKNEKRESKLTESSTECIQPSVIVTGAASGVGWAVTELLAERDWRICLIDRDAEQLSVRVSALLAAGVSAYAYPLDITDDEAVETTIREIRTKTGPIDGLVNCAGVGIEKPFIDLTPADWDRVMSVNLRATFVISRAVAFEMARDASGSIVNIASIDARGTGGQAAPYSASKAGLLGLTRSMAVELGPRGVRVNSVSPGFVDTPFDKWSTEALAHLREDFRRTPIRRILSPREIAESVSFLLSPAASGVTGADLVVDGGLTADWYSVETVPGYVARASSS